MELRFIGLEQMNLTNLVKRSVYGLVIISGVMASAEAAQAKLVMDISSTNTSHPLVTGIESYWEMAVLVLVSCGGVKSINKEENQNDKK